MAGNTVSNKEAYVNQASKHDEHVDGVGRDQTTLQNTLDDLNARSWGDLMDKFTKVHQEWSDDLDRCKAKITEMANFVRDAAGKISDQDSTANI